jgi:hypothetical protein
MLLYTWQYAVALCAPTLGFVTRMPGKRRERNAPLGTVEVGLASMHARAMPRPVAAGPVLYGPPGAWRREVELENGWTALVGLGYDGHHVN